MQRPRPRFLALAALMPAMFAAGPDTAPPAIAAMPFEIQVPMPPTPFHAGGKLHLVYEVHITNFDGLGRSFTLTRLEVLGGEGRSILADYGGSVLERMVEKPGTAAGAEKLQIAGGMRAVAFLWLTFDSAAAVPSALQHRLTFLFPDGKHQRAAQGPEVRVREQAPVVLGPPLRGERWWAAHSASNTSGHRRALAVRNGRATIAQRFAIDFGKFGGDGKHYSGDPKQNRNWYAYGAEVLAVADGIVATVKDGIKENTPQTLPTDITAETIGGNHVVVDIGNNNFVFYAHLQPGQIRVKLGDRVRRGQTIGLLGNSGNSDAPHLHFHVSDKSLDLGGEGLPYEFDSFELLGYGENSDPHADWKSTFTPLKQSQTRVRELPLENSVVAFR